MTARMEAELGEASTTISHERFSGFRLLSAEQADLCLCDATVACNNPRGSSDSLDIGAWLRYQG